MKPKTLVFIFGRFNPPTIGHQRILDAALEIASGADLRIYPSRSQDKKKNPLTFEQKLHYLKQSFPIHSSYFCDNDKARTALDVMTIAEAEDYKKVVMVVGSDRKAEFDRLLNAYNGDLYSIDEIEVISGNERNPHSDGVDGMSATKLRIAASIGDYHSFTLGLPTALPEKERADLFEAVKDGMK